MSRQLGHDLGYYDVVVVGSGSAGSTAAIAAARFGARTLLLEKLPSLGGSSTAVLDTFYGFYTPGSAPRKVVSGIPDDVVSGLRALGPVVERPNTYGAGTGVTYLADHLKVVWDRLVAEAGAHVLLHAFVQAVDETQGRVRSLLVATKAGLARVSARVVIDASGDADVCHFAGFGYELAGELEPAQTLTTTFRLVNVDMAARRQVSKEQFHALMAEAADEGYALPRRDGSDHITPVSGMTATVMTRIEPTAQTRAADGHPAHRVINATDPWFLSRAEAEGRRQAVEYTRFLVDRVPGYQAASLGGLSTQVGVRETRRVYGDYRLTAHDVLTARQFDDQVGLCGAPIEDHKSGPDTVWKYLPDGEVVGIPFRTLLVRDAANVLVAGRCFSATHDAHASVRSMAQCMAMGQAAGTAAAMAACGAIDPRDLNIGSLQAALRAGGASISADETIEPGADDD
jgi:hypothetical protein